MRLLIGQTAPERSTIAGRPIVPGSWVTRIEYAGQMEASELNRIKGTVRHVIADEPFQVVQHSDEVLLVHDKWSLSGTGKTLRSAECDLLEEARSVARVFLTIPLKDLDPDALEMRTFLLKVTS